MREQNRRNSINDREMIDEEMGRKGNPNLFASEAAMAQLILFLFVLLFLLAVKYYMSGFPNNGIPPAVYIQITIQ